jgi:hypothetical protein
MTSKKTYPMLPANNENLLLSFEISDQDFSRFLGEKRDNNKKEVRD